LTGTASDAYKRPKPLIFGVSGRTTADHDAAQSPSLVEGEVL
jgi:hypothetical protein